MRLPWKKKRAPRPYMEIEIPPVAHGGSVLMDGKDISHWVTGIEIDAQAGELSRVTIGLLPDQIRVHVPLRKPVRYVATGEDGVTREVTL